METTFETMPLGKLNNRDLVAYLRHIALNRKNLKPMNSVLLTGREMLEIAARLERLEKACVDARG